MKLVKSPLQMGDRGPEVAHLHDALVFLLEKNHIEVSDDERAEGVKEIEQQLYGKITARLVARFRVRYDLGEGGDMDERTAERVNAVIGAPQPERTEFLVSGHVRNVDGNPLAGLTVKAYDSNHRRKNLLLGEGLTTEEGLFAIPYTAKQFRQFEKPRADLFVSVFKSDKQLLETSPIRFRAEAVETIDFIIDREEYRSPSEYERLMTELNPFLKDDLTAEEIEYLARKIGIDRRHIAWLVQARKLAQEIQLTTEKGASSQAFYSWFRLDLLTLPTDLRAFWALSTDILITTLKTAVEQRIVPSNISASLDEISAHIEQIKLDSVLHAPALGLAVNLSDLLATLPEPLNPSQQHAIAATVAELRPEDPKLAERIKSIPGLEGDANRVARTIRLGALTNGHLPLTQALQSRLRNADEHGETLLPLAALPLYQWIDLAHAYGVSEKTTLTPVAYAKALASNVERLHPTATLAANLTNGRRLANQPILAEVGTFLQDNPDFDIVTANLNTLSKQAEPDRVLASKHKQVVEGLRVLQRMHVLEASWEESATLLENDIYAPHQLLAAGPAQLTALLDGQIAPERVAALHQRAEDLHDLTLAVFTTAFSALNAPNILPGLVIPGGGNPINPDDPEGAHSVDPRIAAMRGSVSGTRGIVPRPFPAGAVGAPVIPAELSLANQINEVIANEPTLQALFGAQEACACGHCSSVLSPAAYFVDVLEFIKKAELLKPLLLHRPDLQDIELSCNNTNSEVPAIDLALEILENAVAFAPPLNVDLPAGTDILAELSGQTDSGAIRDTLMKTVRTLSSDLSAKQEGQDSEWTVIDGHRRWKLRAYAEQGLWSGSGKQLETIDLDMSTLIAGLDQKQFILLAKTNFNKLIAPFRNQPPDLNNYDVTITPRVEGQSWKVTYQFSVQVQTLNEPVPRLLLKTPGGDVWWGQEDNQVLLEEGAIQTINRALLRGAVPEIIHSLLIDRFYHTSGYTVRSTRPNSWTIKSDPKELILLFLPASIQITSLTYQSGDPKVDAVAEPENHNPEAYERLKGKTFPWSLPIDLPLEEVRLYLERARSSRQRLIELMMPINQKVRENILFAREVLGLSEAEADVIAPPSAPKIFEHWGIAPNATSIVDVASARIVTGASPLDLLKNVSILLQQSRLSFEALQAIIETQFVMLDGAPLRIEPAGSCKPSEMKLPMLTPEHLDRIHRFARLQRRIGWSTLELDTAIKITTGAALNADTLLHLANFVCLHELLDLPVSAILAWWSNPVDDANLMRQLARALDTTSVELESARALLNVQNPFFGNTNSVASSGDILRFCEQVTEFQRSNITFENLRYLLQHFETPGSSVTLDDKQLMQLADVARIALQVILDDPEKLSSLTTDDAEGVAIRRACEDTIIAAFATSLGVEREQIDNLLRTRLRHPSNPNKAAIDVFLSSVGDFTDLWGLVGKLVTHTDAVSLYLWERFSPKVQQVLANPKATVMRQQNILVSALNEILRGNSIFERSRFAEVKLSAETRDLIQQSPTEKNQILLNRLLLEDAYRLEIVKHQRLDLLFIIGDIIQPRSAAIKSVLVRLYKTLFICDALKLNRANLNLLRTSTSDKNGFVVLDFNTLPVFFDTVSASVSGHANVEGFAQLLALAQLRVSAANLLHQYAALDFTVVGSMDAAHILLAAGVALNKSEVEAAAAQLGITSVEQHRDPTNLARLIKLLTALKQLGATVDETRNQTDDAGHPKPVPPDVPNGLIAPSPTEKDASNARTLLRNKNDESNWHKLIKPIADTLRERQREALVDYLVDRDQMRGADDLYERYLIDVQTGSCLKTTRLLQATAAAQLFVQRVILNLEKNLVLSPDKRQLWGWMHSYRVWEANRKVFLFPENWLLPELRDDKTAIFRQMESTLGEQEPSPENTRAALLGYLDDLGDLAQIRVIAMYEDRQNIGTELIPVWKETLYVIGRSPNEPYRYFWRSCAEFDSAKISMSWSGWEALDLDNANDFIMPFVFEGDLHVAWPIFRKTNVEKSTTSSDPVWEVQIAWQRRTGQTWTKRKMSHVALSSFKRLLGISELRSFVFRVRKDEIVLPRASNLRQDRIKIDCYAAEDPAKPKIYPEVKDQKDMPTRPQGTGFATDQRNVYLTMSCEVWEKYKISGETTDTFRPAKGITRVRLDYPMVVNDVTGLSLPTNFHASQGGEAKWIFPELKVQVHGSIKLTVIHVGPSGTRELQASLTDIDANGNIVRTNNTHWTWEPKLVFDIAAPTEHPYLPDRPVSFAKASGSFVLTSGHDMEILNPSDAEDIGSLEVMDNPPMERLGNQFVWTKGADVVRLPSDNHLYVKPEFGSRVLITFATIAPEAPSGRPKTWHLQDANVGYYLGQKSYTWHLYPDGQDFVGVYRSIASVSTFKLFAPAIQAMQRDKQPPTLPPLGRLSTTSPSISFARTIPYANYNWELFLHAPLAIVDYLASQQRFEEARRWLHTIFDPTIGDKDEQTGIAKFWRFLPFHNDSQPDSIAQMLKWLADPDSTDPNHESTMGSATFEDKFGSEIEQWKQNPFMPHLVARLRPSAYQWHTFFAYLEVLIGWGDQLFRRDTRESVNEATLLYVLAAKLLGPRPLVIPAPTPPAPQTYRSLPRGTDGYLDGFSNAWVKYADLSGFKKLLKQSLHKNPTTLWERDSVSFDDPLDNQPPSKKQTASLLDSLGALAFCIPQNEKVTEFYDRLTERLNYVRNCRNIDGVFRELPLYEPPIDPLLLIRAKAAGLDINDVLDDLYAPLPNYRFSFTLQKALELCAELKSLGSALLAALEKKDAEELTLLRSSHEIAMLTLVSNIRKQQIAEAEANITTLQQSKETILECFGQYQKLLGKPSITKGQDGLPVVEQSSSLAVSTDPGGGVSGLGLVRTEVAQLNWTATANTYNQVANSAHVVAGVLSVIPNLWVGAPTSGQTFGGSNLGSAASAIAKAIETGAVNANFLAHLMGTLAGYERRQDDWVHQSKLALDELKQLDKQIIAAQIRKDIAQREFDNHDKQIENAQTIDAFMRGKFTNQQLYRWMSSQIAEVYFRTYQLALDQARRAERAYQHELGLNNISTPFIQSGSWDNLKKGLLAGDHLYQALKRMESTYLERNVREFEITKHISLLQLDPLALINLRETTTCLFSLSEVLFDLDFPTHYLRRIKSISLSIPCVTGPYASVSTTLKLKSSKTRYKSSPADLPQDYKLLSTIVTSSGQMDSGMFETNLRDERYLPFEGAGAISDWELSLPKEFHQFDYSTISDVVLHLRYTAKEGSTDRTDTIRPSLNALRLQSQDTGLAQLFSLRYHFPTQWHQLRSSAVHKADFAILPLHFPMLVKGKKIKISKVDFKMILKEPLKEPKVNMLSTSLELPALANIVWTSPSTLPPAPPQYFTGSLNPLLPAVMADLAKEHSTTTLRIKFNEVNTTDTVQIEDVQDIMVILYYKIEPSSS
jgi:hypothetical protein